MRSSDDHTLAVASVPDRHLCHAPTGVNGARSGSPS